VTIIAFAFGEDRVTGLDITLDAERVAATVR
jgi:hypothetical protein